MVVTLLEVSQLLTESELKTLLTSSRDSEDSVETQVTSYLRQNGKLDNFFSTARFHKIQAGLIKNEVKALEYKKRGNIKFGKRDYVQACVMYTQALRYASSPVSPASSSASSTSTTPSTDTVATPPPLNSQLYNNRASALLHLSCPQHALLDAERALRHHPSYTKARLALGESLLKLGRKTQAQAELLSVSHLPRGQKLLAELKLDPLDRSVTSASNKLASVNTYLIAEEVDQHQQGHSHIFHMAGTLEETEFTGRGKGLLVKERIEKDVELLREDPWACVLGSRFRGNRCEHCTKPFLFNCTLTDRTSTERRLTLADTRSLPAPVPCEGCSRVLFCSETCRNASSATGLYSPSSSSSLSLSLL